MLYALLRPATHEFYDTVLQNEPPLILIIIHCFFLTFALLFSIYGCRMCFRAKSYHYNTCRLFCTIMMSWMSLLTSKILVFTFYLENNSNSNNQTVSQNLEDVMTTPQFSFLKYSAFFRYFYLAFATSAPLASSIERSFATWFIADYEKKKRAWIFVGISTAETIFGLVIAVACAFFHLQIIFLVSVIVLLETICAIIISYLYYYNKKQLYILEQFHRKTHYSLSIRFQLRENIQVLTIIMQIIVLSIIMIIFIVIIIIIPIILNLPPLVSTIVHTLSDFCSHCNPIFIVIISILTIPEWKAQCLAEIGVNHRKIEVFNPRPLVVEADVYFDMFKKAME